MPPADSRSTWRISMVIAELQILSCGGKQTPDHPACPQCPPHWPGTLGGQGCREIWDTSIQVALPAQGNIRILA